MEALAEASAAAPDGELLDEATAEGIDVNAEASRVQDLLLGAVARAKKERLHIAQRAHEESVAKMAERAARLPSDAVGRKALLMSVVQRHPQMRGAVVTLQHREFESLSDGDIESALRQLDVLGMLDDDEVEPRT
jgi:hypothetical protein